MVVIRSLRSFLLNSRRMFTSKQLIYEEYGDPEKVLKLKSVECGDKLNASDVHVRWLAAAINPADMNQIQGIYPIKPKLPAVGGNEGFGMVQRVGSEVRNLSPGDHVIVLNTNSWLTESICDQNNLLKIDKDIPSDMATTIKVNPPTAYRMLNDFVELRENDIIIQNGANSAVGRAVIQIAHAMNVKTMNIIRSRDRTEETEELISDLRSLGADYVFTEEQFRKERNNVPSSRLALNCVGGKNTLMLASNLGRNGVLVTYGGMSKQPIQVPTGPLIFKDISLRGFWMTNWYSSAKDEEIHEMLENILDIVRRGKLQPPAIERIKLNDWKIAIKNAMTSGAKKQILVFD